MSNEEIKSEINGVLDQLSNESLQEVLRVVKSFEDKSATIFDPLKIQIILSRDKELLQKLAQ
jgi:hypothetical protein